jgi:hypothetical protein
MQEPASTRWFDAFAQVSDPRSTNARHRLCDICVIALGAVISGAEGWEDLAESGQAQAEWLQQFLERPPGIPSHDTCRRGRSRLQPDALPQCVVHWTEALRASRDGDLVAVEGKPRRRSCDPAASQGALHMVSAWAHAQRLVFGHRTVEDQSHEITAIPPLRRM